MRSTRSVAILLLGLGTARAEAPANPHGGADTCAVCHAPAETGTGPALPIVATCKTCHPGADHHPDSMVPGDIQSAPGWPLEDGKVTCATCHVEPGHAGLAGTPTPYLRGGPYAQGGDFCYSCHGRTSVVRSDPHHPGSWYAADDPSCMACHDGVPERGVAPEQARLRLGPQGVCSTCHPGVPHWGVALHLGKVVPEDVRPNLPPEMPLLADGAMSCWTCHDVHAGHDSGDVSVSALAKGLHDAALAATWSDVPPDAIFPASHPEHPPMLARSLADNALCSTCHGEGP